MNEWVHLDQVESQLPQMESQLHTQQGHFRREEKLDDPHWASATAFPQ